MTTRNAIRILLAACALFASAVSAQGFSAVVSPPRFEDSAKPGTTYRNVVEIDNVSAESAHFTVKTADWTLMPDGGVQYSSQGGGGRPAITAAAIACLFNAGEYDSEYVPKLLDYCKKNLSNIQNEGFGHWHYAHYYYAQVCYREGDKVWDGYREKIFARLVSEAASDGSWSQGYIGAVYTTAVNLTILQLEQNALPIYQR